MRHIFKGVQTLVPFVLLIGVGALIAVQATLNGTVGRSAGLALFVVCFSALQTAFALPGLALGAWPPRFSALWSVPWWNHTGALFGVLIVIGIAHGVPRTGTFAGMCALLVGQLVMGVAIDSMGWLGATVQPLTWNKIIGLGFLTAGMAFIK